MDKIAQIIDEYDVSEYVSLHLPEVIRAEITFTLVMIVIAVVGLALS